MLSILRNLRRRLEDKLRKLFKIKMRQDVRLFIGGMEVDFQGDPGIYYNYDVTELTNPTIVKNSFSKTFTIGGTPNNNKIFGQFWNLERLQSYGMNYTGVDFNPSQKVGFQLYINGEIYESGYVKLEEVRKRGNTVEYDIQLYGGLGELFYILSYDDTGNKLSLADLTYRGESGGTDEFDFILDREALFDAWFDDTPYADYTSLWHYINFVPSYNGKPDNFSADKVLVNFNGSALFDTTTVSGQPYASVNGYGLGTLPAEMGEWETRDLRSYLQRPAVRMKEIVNACAKYAEQYGYQIEFDSTFFDTQNPYWNNTWVTLEKFSDLPADGTDGESGTTVSPSAITATHLYTGEPVVVDLEEAYTLDLGGTGSDAIIDFSFKICQQPGTASTQYMTGKESMPIYTSALNMNKFKDLGGVAVQVLCFDSNNIASANVVGGSDTVILASKLGTDYVKAENSGLQQFYGAPIKYSFGKFLPVGSFVYKWSEEINLRVNVPASTVAIAIDVQQIANGMRGDFYLSQNNPEIWRWNSDINTLAMRPNIGIVLANASATAYSASETAGHTGAKITKQMLLSTEDTPADYLLSYCKMFGLYFLKDAKSKKVSIMTRDTFYQTGNTVSIEDFIDRKQDIRITPIAFDCKWYDLYNENVGGEFYEKYKSAYGREYGIQRINTGYDFNADSKNLLEDNVFKGAVQGTQRSQYMLAPLRFAPSYVMPAYVLQGFSYELYGEGGNTATVVMDAQDFQKEPLGRELYYDGFSKVQFEDEEGKGIDGKNVLVLFNGIFDVENVSGTSIPYYLTDDLSMMGVLNGGNPCWLYTESEYSSGGTRIAYQTYRLPQFGRYIINRTTDYITRSMDFGEPRELYVPEAVTRAESTIYYSYWKKYLSDMYDINTRILECYAVINDKPNPEWLRRFYWFDNSIWRLNKITDWNPAGYNPTKIEFIKVQDKADYTLVPVSEYSELAIILSQYAIDASGGTITGKVIVPDGDNWYMEYPDDVLTIVPSNGTGDANITITVPSYTGSTDRQFAISVLQEAGVTAYITQYGLIVFGVSPANLAAFAGAMDATLSITDNNEGWDIVCPAWVTLSDYGGVGSKNVSVHINANLDESGRTGNIVITNRTTSEQLTVPVTQDGSIPATVAPVMLMFGSPASGTAQLNITDVSGRGWNLVPTGNWFTVSAQSGTGNQFVTVYVAENETGYSRNSLIVFEDATSGDVTNITINQQA